RFPGDYDLISPGYDPAMFAPAAKSKTIVVEIRPNERPFIKTFIALLSGLPGWELVLLRTTPLVGRPTIPRALASRVHVKTARTATARAAIRNAAAIFVPGVNGSFRVRAEAEAAGCAIAGGDDEPAVAEVTRLATDNALLEREAAQAIERS